MFAISSESLIGEIYNLLGVTNIANSEEDPYGSGYPALSEEMVLDTFSSVKNFRAISSDKGAYGFQGGETILFSNRKVAEMSKTS